MSAHQAVFPVAVMARVLGVSEAGFHAWRRRPVSAHAVADAALLKRIRTIHAGSRQTYGAPRVHAELRAGGERHGRKRIARLMRAAGLIGASRRRGTIVTTRRDKEARPAPDLVDRDFTAFRPNQLWVADITFVPTASGFLYLAVVLDAWSRKIVGWSMANHLRDRTGAGRAGDGDRPAAAGRRHPPQRPGQPIHVIGVRKTLQGGWRPAVDGIGRRCLRQRHVRELLRHARMRAAGATQVHVPRSRPRWPASASSKVGTTRCGCTQPSATARQWPMKQRWRRSRQNRNHPSPTPLYETEATSLDRWRTSCGGGNASSVRSKFPDQTKGRGCEGVGSLRDRNGQRNHSRYAVLRKFDLGNQRRQGCRIADVGSKQNDPENE